MTDTEYISIFNACSIQNVEAASRGYFPLPDLSRKIERDSARRVDVLLHDSRPFEEHQLNIASPYEAV